MKKLRMSMFLLMLIGFAGNLRAQRILGYFPNYSSVGSEYSLQYSKLTDIVFGFVNPDTTGNLGTIINESALTYILSQTHQNSGRVIISTGGAGNNTLFTMASNNTYRANFIQNMLTYIDAKGADGWDLDWEFPNTSAQIAAHLQLIKDVRTAFDAYETLKGKHLSLSIAVGGEIGHTKYLDTAVYKYLDFVSIMAYDAPSSLEPSHSSYSFAQNAISIWANTGLSKSKMLLGVPFYARTYPTRTSGTYLNISNLSGTTPAQVYVSDVYNGNVYYNGAPTLKSKVDLIMNAGGLGITIWELTQDRVDQYSLLSALFSKMSVYRCAKPELGQNLTLCGSSAVNLNAHLSNDSFRKFTWFKDNQKLSDTTVLITIQSAGTYIVKADSFNVCSQSDTMTVYAGLPSINFTNQDICNSSSVLLDTKVSGPSIKTVWYKDGSILKGENTSTLKVRKSGVYNVDVIDTTSTCSTQTGSVTFTSSMIDINDDTICKGNIANLTINSSGNQFEWYDQASGGNLLSQGNNYQSPVLSTSAVYYVQQSTAIQSGVTGKTTKQTGWYDYAYPASKYQQFQVFKTLSLDTISVYPYAASKFQFIIYGADKTTIVCSTAVLNLNIGEQKIVINQVLQPGTYFIAAKGNLSSDRLWLESDATGGPISVANTITIAQYAIATYGATTYYGSFFSWKYSSAAKTCARTEVDVIVHECNINAISEDALSQSITVFPNPVKDKLTIESTSLDLENSLISIYNLNGNQMMNHQLIKTQEFDVSKLQSGVYILKITPTNKQTTFHKFIKF